VHDAVKNALNVHALMPKVVLAADDNSGCNFWGEENSVGQVPPFYCFVP
jgi:hypothetical protein